MVWMLAAAAWAGPPEAPKLEIEVVHDVQQQGQFKLVWAGRDGDTVKVDGWPFGTLPLETELAEGLHTLQIEGASGKISGTFAFTAEAGKVVEIDLADALAPEPVVAVSDPPGPAPATEETPAPN